MAEKSGMEPECYKGEREGEDTGFKKFIWNSERNEFCGRNAASWLKITIFYIIFYFALAGFWTVMLLVFYQTLDQYKPVWTLDSSRIGSNPGVGFRPLPPAENVDSTLIWFTHGSEGSGWSEWVVQLENFLTPYKIGQQSGEYIRACDVDVKIEENHVCQFDWEKISGFCSKSNNFGFDVGRPCIAIKLNRIYGWEPEPFKNTSFPSAMPEHIRKVYDPNFVYVSCQGENPADKENIGPIKYYPENGKIPNYYFPFTNLEGYLSPFVFVHFERPQTGVLINIECKAWANNIHHDRSDRLGSVHLELLID